jgi:hypothetical protein
MRRRSPKTSSFADPRGNGSLPRASIFWAIRFCIERGNRYMSRTAEGFNSIVYTLPSQSQVRFHFFPRYGTRLLEGLLGVLNV